MTRKSVIMITLDCARPDHLGCYGYKGVDTPYLDKFAKKGILFNQAMCQAPNTWISHASVFTGCDPYVHGIRTPFSKLSSSVRTMAEVFSENGYATAGFPSHTLLGSANGFGRGFQLFDENKDSFLHSSNEDGHMYNRDWGEIWEKSTDWMLKQTKPFLIWMHYMGIHEVRKSDLNIPEDFLKKYSPMGQHYDAKISWADIQCIKPLYEFLRDQSLLNDVIVMFFSDHGDKFVSLHPGQSEDFSFAKHNEYRSDDVMRICLVLNNGNSPFLRNKINSQIRSIDILPSLLSLIKIPIPDCIDGCNVLIQNDGETGEHRFSYMENISRGWIGIRTGEWKLILVSEKHKQARQRVRGIHQLLNDLTVMLQDRKEGINRVFYFFLRGLFASLGLLNRFLTFFSPGRGNDLKDRTEFDLTDDLSEIEEDIVENCIEPELYDLINDPMERKNVSAEHPRIVIFLKNEIKKRLSRSSGSIDLIDDEDKEEVVEKLDHLGYL